MSNYVDLPVSERFLGHENMSSKTHTAQADGVIGLPSFGIRILKATDAKLKFSISGACHLENMPLQSSLGTLMIN